MGEPRTLAVVLGEPIATHWFPEEAGAAITLAGRRFIDRTDDTGWAGFYDWLRPSPDRILGVRCWLNMLAPEEAQEIRVAAAGFSAVERTGEELRIWFSSRRDLD